jgi:hypothetical protein
MSAVDESASAVWLGTLDREVFACTVGDEDGDPTLAQMELPGGPVAICFSEAGLATLPDEWDLPFIVLDVADLHHWWPPGLGLWLDPGEDGGGVVYSEVAVRTLSRVTSLRGSAAALADWGASHDTIVVALADIVLRPSPDVVCAWVAPSPFDESLAVCRIVLEEGATTERADEVADDLAEALLLVAGVSCRTMVEVVDGSLLRDDGLDPAQWDSGEMALVFSRLDPPPPASAPLGPFSRLWVPMAARSEDGSIGAPTVEADGATAVIGFSTEDRAVAVLLEGAPYLEVVLREMEPWPDDIDLLLDPGYDDERIVSAAEIDAALTR